MKPDGSDRKSKNGSLENSLKNSAENNFESNFENYSESNERDELLFKEAASLYVKREGDKLMGELAALRVDEATSGVDLGVDRGRLIRKKLMAERVKKATYVFASIAACLIIALIGIRFGGRFNAGSQTNSPAIADNDTAPQAISTRVNGNKNGMMADNSPPTTAATATAPTTTAPSVATAATTTAPNKFTTAAPNITVATTAAPVAPQTTYPAEPQTTYPAEPPPTYPAAPPRTEIIYLSTRLPTGYEITKTDYDYEKTIYYIKNDYNNEIVLVAEPFKDKDKSLKDSIDSEDYLHLMLNGTNAYVLARKDYNVLKTETDGLLYTLSSAHEARDLIEIALVLI
jgi:hypothetical protein